MQNIIGSWSDLIARVWKDDAGGRKIHQAYCILLGKKWWRPKGVWEDSKEVELVDNWGDIWRVEMMACDQLNTVSERAESKMTLL